MAKNIESKEPGVEKQDDIDAFNGDISNTPASQLEKHIKELSHPDYTPSDWEKNYLEAARAEIEKRKEKGTYLSPEQEKKQFGE